MSPVRSMVPMAALIASLAACGPDAGTRPHDMSAAAHDQAASGEEAQVNEHCGSEGPCWRSSARASFPDTNMADEHRRLASEHRAAAHVLRDVEATACVGISETDRDISPFEHRDDIVSVTPATEPRPAQRGSGGAGRATVGIAVTFRAVPGLTGEWLQHEIDCHLARNAAMGHSMPEMPTCPLVPTGVQARVASSGGQFVVTVRSDDPAVVPEIQRRGALLAAAR